MKEILKKSSCLIYGILIISFVNNLIYAENWKDSELSTQDCVVQVFSQIAKFNWVEPYKSPEQFQASGTAFFINDEGHLLTNFHVIDQAKFIYINLPSLGRRPLEVEVIGAYPEGDIALMKLTQDSYAEIINFLGYVPYLNLGDSDTLYKTEPVLALGYPLGQRYLKSTVGVVAGRDYIDGVSYVHITAPINPGNSGGPLLNISGEVVGINTAYVPGSQNIGYIIPINEVKNILDDLYKVKLYRKPIIGISCNHATDDHMRSLGNPVPGGLYINYVLPNSLAEKAGIEMGDMLYEIVWQDKSYLIDEYGDIKVDWRNSDKVILMELINRFQLKDDFKLVVYRNGAKLELSCLFDCQENSVIRYIYPDYEPQEIDYEIFAGAVFMQLRGNHFGLLPENSILNQYRRPELHNEEAIVITNIFPGSMMHKVRCFYPGMIVDSINDCYVRNLSDLRKALISSAKLGTVSIKTKDHVVTVLSLDQILEQEPKLSNNFVYPMSSIVVKLLNLKGNSPQS